MQIQRYTTEKIEEFINQYGAKYLFENERFYENMILLLNKQDDTHFLSKYFQVHVRYLWLKSGFIKPKNKKGDLLLFKKGPKFIMSRSKSVPLKDSSVLNEEKNIDYKQNAKTYRGKLKHVERKFKTKYPFICGICEKRKKKGIGFYTICEEFFLCDDCLKKFNFPTNVAEPYRFISTPMGGQNKRY